MLDIFTQEKKTMFRVEVDADADETTPGLEYEGS